MKALVIVHLSSLDNYAEFAHDATGSYQDAYDLARRIVEAVAEFPGKVYIIDQYWRLLPEPSSGPRAEILPLLQERRDAVWIEFDEQVSDWEPFLKKLEARLKKDRVTHVTIGGIWHDPSLEYGCATTVYLHLRRKFSAKVDPTIVGCETDYGSRGDPHNVFRK